MADVHAAAIAGFGGQGDQLRRFGVIRRRVDQRRADAHRAFLHRLADQRAHLRQLGGRRIDVLFAELMHANGGRSDERGEVGRDALLRHVVEIFAERGPADRIFDVALPLELEPLHFGRQGTHRIAFAHDFERDALRGVAKAAAVGDQAFVRPAQHVDEARRDGLARSRRQFAQRVPARAGPT